MDLKLIRFASGRHHHQSKQPMLVVFTDDGRRSTAPESSGESSVCRRTLKVGEDLRLVAGGVDQTFMSWSLRLWSSGLGDGFGCPDNPHDPSIDQLLSV